MIADTLNFFLVGIGTGLTVGWLPVALCRLLDSVRSWAEVGKD